MAKSRTTVRERAVRRFWDELGLAPGSFPITVFKARSRKEIVVNGVKGGLPIRFSYKGGVVRLIKVGP